MYPRHSSRAVAMVAFLMISYWISLCNPGDFGSFKYPHITKVLYKGVTTLWWKFRFVLPIYDLRMTKLRPKEAVNQSGVEDLVRKKWL